MEGHGILRQAQGARRSAGVDGAVPAFWRSDLSWSSVTQVSPAQSWSALRMCALTMPSCMGHADLLELVEDEVEEG